MSRDKPVLRALKLLSLIERHPNGLRVTDMAQQLDAPPRAIYRDLEVLQQLPAPIYTDKNGKESYWKIDPDFRKNLTIPFTLQSCSPSISHGTQFGRWMGPSLPIHCSRFLKSYGQFFPSRSLGKWLICAGLSFPGFRRKRNMGPIGS